jgi:hypothetical protein
MLLTDMLKNTSEEHIEYNNLKLALKSIEDVATWVNEGKRKNENEKVIKDLQIKLKGLKKLKFFR